MKKIIPWILVILWCAVIFNFSAEDRNTSHNRSEGITEVVEKVVERVEFTNIDKGNLKDQLEHYIRKTAHVSEYFVLTVLIFYALGISNVVGRKRYIYTVILPILYACFDEFHQMFVPGRGPMVKDVFVDSMGVLIAFLLCYGMRNLFSLWVRE